MNEGINKFYWGFLFIMFSFRLQGFDIFPDIIGYLFFAVGFKELASGSIYFTIAEKYNIYMIVFSIFSIYQKPVQAGSFQLGVMGGFGTFLMVVSFALDLLIVYNLFLGIKDMAENQERFVLANESHKKWYQYMILKCASFFSFILIFLPSFAVVYFITIFAMSIILAISIMYFLRRCSESLIVST